MKKIELTITGSKLFDEFIAIARSVKTPRDPKKPSLNSEQSRQIYIDTVYARLIGLLAGKLDHPLSLSVGGKSLMIQLLDRSIDMRSHKRAFQGEYSAPTLLFPEVEKNGKILFQKKMAQISAIWDGKADIFATFVKEHILFTFNPH